MAKSRRKAPAPRKVDLEVVVEVDRVGELVIPMATLDRKVAVEKFCKHFKVDVKDLPHEPRMKWQPLGTTPSTPAE